MTVLVIGLIAFLGLHSVRVFAEPWRARQLATLGDARWKGLYSLASIVTLALLVWGYAMARVGSPIVWSPPKALHYVTALLVLCGFLLYYLFRFVRAALTQL